jgi:Uma2 family endonuclease
MSTVADDWLHRHRIDVDEYYRMAEVGLLAPGARVELIQGEIIDMVPIGSLHASVVNALARRFFHAVGDRAIVTVQQPIRLDRRSEPQPDLALVKPRADFYRAAHPAPADVLLVVEVSDTTLRYDRDIKLPLYASHEIPEVWLFDINSNVVHRLQQPINGAYATITALQGGLVEPSLLPGVSIDLAGVLDF